jgi:hypothetical protein
MVRENDRWKGALDSLQLLQEAFWYGFDVFRLELVKAWRAMTDYISRAALQSVHAQLARVLFIVGRSGLLLGIGEALGRVCACGGSVAQPPCRSAQAT